MRTPKHALLHTFVALIANCLPSLAAEAPPPQPTAVEISPIEQQNRPGLWRGIVDGEGGLWTAVYPSPSRLELVSPTGVHLPLSPPDHAPSGIALAPAGHNQVWTTFRSKEPQRGLYLSRSDATGTLYEVGGDTIPLARMQLTPTADGGARIIWYGEKAQPDSPGYPHWIYVNQISADGKVGDPQRVMPGTMPVWQDDGKGGQAIFSWYKVGEQFQIAMRFFSSNGELGPQISVATTPRLGGTLRAFTSRDRWFAYWAFAEGDPPAHVVAGAYSDDKGQTWHTFSLDALAGMLLTSIEAAVDGNGHISYVATGTNQVESPVKPQRVVLLTSPDNGNTWNEPISVREASAGSTKAPTAKVAYVGPNHDRILVLYEDWRHIRSSIRYWLSEPGTTSWSVRDSVLPLSESYSFVLDKSDPTIYSLPSGATFILERQNDNFMGSILVSLHMSLRELQEDGRNNPLGYMQPDQDRLISRVNSYGTALIAKDYQGAYQLFDPFYRARVDFLGHLRAQGRIQYTTAEHHSSSISGDIAEVQFHIIASVPRFSGEKGQTYESEERDVTIPVHWIWIDHDWYMEYYSEARNERFTRY